MIAEPEMEFLFDVEVDLEAPQIVGATAQGTRLVYYVKGGQFQGPRLSGTVLPGGGDWLLIRPDGVGVLDVGANLQADDRALIYTFYRGYISASPQVWARFGAGEKVDPSEYYFRTSPVYETASEAYADLTRRVCVAVGRVEPNRVRYAVHAVT